jgi:hypothetical protein
MISDCVRPRSLPPGDLDEAAQPVGTSEQTVDIDRCLLGRIDPRCLRSHRGTSIPSGRSSIWLGARSTTMSDEVLQTVTDALARGGHQDGPVCVRDDSAARSAPLNHVNSE